jgi:hypothetical protein
LIGKVLRGNAGDVARALALEDHLFAAHGHIEAFLVAHLETLTVDGDRARSTDVDDARLATLQNEWPAALAGTACSGSLIGLAPGTAPPITKRSLCE